MGRWNIRRLIADFNVIGRNTEVDNRNRFVHGDLEGGPRVSKHYRDNEMNQGEGPRRQECLPSRSNVIKQGDGPIRREYLPKRQPAGGNRRRRYNASKRERELDRRDKDYRPGRTVDRADDYTARRGTRSRKLNVKYNPDEYYL